MWRLENEEPEQQVVGDWRRQTQHPKSAPDARGERKLMNKQSIQSL